MLSSNSVDKHLYADLQEQIKKLNIEYYNQRKSREYKVGMVLNETLKDVKCLKIKELIKNYKRWIGGYNAKNMTTVERKFVYNPEKSEAYFCDERIAVYTVIFGHYDEVLEPYCAPDNIDYYIITDQNINLENSKWKKLDIKKYEKILSGMTNAEKNRFFKMMPCRVFADYNYSIYVDGNIQIIADVTTFISKIGEPGIAAHWHSSRDCIYNEIEAVLQAKKEKKDILVKHKKHLIEEDFPTHFGLVECNVLVRKHSEVCNKMMEEWWQEFNNYSKRDQLSFPFVIFKNGFTVDQVTTLGVNVFKNPSIRVKIHN